MEKLSFLVLHRAPLQKRRKISWVYLSQMLVCPPSMTSFMRRVSVGTLQVRFPACCDRGSDYVIERSLCSP